MPAFRVLIVDDEPVLNSIMKKSLERAHEDWEIDTEHRSGIALGRLLSGEHFDVIFLDIIMPYMNGMIFFETLQREKKFQHLCRRVIFITGAVLDPAVRAFAQTIPNRFIEKPFTALELEDAIIELLKNASK